MTTSLIETLLKAVGGFGISEYQKNRLTTEALKDGELMLILPCSITESGVLGYQNGQVAITKSTIVLDKQVSHHK
jgi:hypothetical protein